MRRRWRTMRHAARPCPGHGVRRLSRATLLDDAECDDDWRFNLDERPIHPWRLWCASARHAGQPVDCTVAQRRMGEGRAGEQPCLLQFLFSSSPCLPQVFVNGQFLGGNAEIQAMGKAVKKKFVEAGVVM